MSVVAVKNINQSEVHVEVVTMLLRHAHIEVQEGFLAATHNTHSFDVEGCIPVSERQDEA